MHTSYILVGAFPITDRSTDIRFLIVVTTISIHEGLAGMAISINRAGSIVHHVAVAWNDVGPCKESQSGRHILLSLLVREMWILPILDLSPVSWAIFVRCMLEPAPSQTYTQVSCNAWFSYDCDHRQISRQREIHLGGYIPFCFHCVCIREEGSNVRIHTRSRYCKPICFEVQQLAFLIMLVSWCNVMKICEQSKAATNLICEMSITISEIL